MLSIIELFFRSQIFLFSEHACVFLTDNVFMFLNLKIGKDKGKIEQ